jgi:hypothetical protein
MKPLLYSLVITSCALFFSACERKEETLGEKIEDKVKDGLDARPAEGIRDVGEEIKDAAKDATN